MRVLAGAAPVLLAALGACDRGSESSPSPAPTSRASSAALGVTSTAGAPARLPAAPSGLPPAPRESCDRFAEAAVPDADLPSPAEREALRGCDAEALYYGIDTPVDYARARHCAYAELGVDGAPAVGGAEILMMIYANGRGVPPNLDLALRFACRAAGASAEQDARVARLWQARSRPAPSFEPAFDVCDDVVSSVMSGYCAALDERRSALSRAARRRRAMLGMPGSAARLEAAAQRFFDDRSRLEVDQTGTARARARIEERARLEDEFVDMLERLRDPTFTPEPRAEQPLAAQLTQLLSRIAACKDLAELEQLVPGSVTRAGVRRTQSSYLAYRAAFVAVALAVRPGSGRAAWLAWLDEKRVTQLRELGDGC